MLTSSNWPIEPVENGSVRFFPVGLRMCSMPSSNVHGVLHVFVGNVIDQPVLSDV